MKLPIKSDGTHYDIPFLHDDQQKIVAVVLQRLYDFLRCTSFTPLRLTVSGVTASGKSTLTQTPVSTVRQLFQRNDVIQVCAPTGSAAFSAGGETIHRLFGVCVHNSSTILNSTAREKLQSKFANLLVLIVDERSMLSSELFGIMETYARQVCHNGRNTSKMWGGIPAIILVGDDYQLPPIYKGAFEALSTPAETLEQLRQIQSTQTNRLIISGHLQFRVFAQSVMYLLGSQRALPGQQRLARILEGIRSENNNGLSDDDITFLANNFHLMSSHFSNEDRKKHLSRCAVSFCQQEATVTSEPTEAPRNSHGQKSSYKDQIKNRLWKKTYCC